MLLGAYYGTGSTSVSNGSGALGEKGDRCTSLSCESIPEALGRPCRGITHSDLRASPSLVLLRPRCIQHPPDATPCTLRASQRASERAHVHACSHSCTITLRASHSPPAPPPPRLFTGSARGGILSGFISRRKEKGSELLQQKVNTA